MITVCQGVVMRWIVGDILTFLAALVGCIFVGLLLGGFVGGVYYIMSAILE